MRVEIELLQSSAFGEGVDGAAPMKIRKVIYYPNGTVHSKYGLSWLTGEWIQVGEGNRYPDETIMDRKLWAKMHFQGARDGIRSEPQYAKEGKLRGLGFVNLIYSKCQTLMELYQRTPQGDRDYWLMTELFVMLHGGDVCDKAFDKGD